MAFIVAANEVISTTKSLHVKTVGFRKSKKQCIGVADAGEARPSMGSSYGDRLF